MWEGFGASLHFLRLGLCAWSGERSLREMGSPQYSQQDMESSLPQLRGNESYQHLHWSKHSPPWILHEEGQPPAPQAEPLPNPLDTSLRSLLWRTIRGQVCAPHATAMWSFAAQSWKMNTDPWNRQLTSSLRQWVYISHDWAWFPRWNWGAEKWGRNWGDSCCWWCDTRVNSMQYAPAVHNTGFV